MIVMDIKNIIGNKVMNNHTRSIGIIKNVTENHVEIDFHGDIKKYSYPSAFYDILEIEDEKTQNILSAAGSSSRCYLSKLHPR